MRSGPPLGSRILLALLLTGAGGRTVRGDLEEEFSQRVASGDRLAGAWFRSQAIRSVVAWWRLEAIRERIRSRRRRRLMAPIGGAERHKAREGMMGSVWMDALYALKGLRRTPGFLLVVITTLGLGIGAATTIFSVVDGVLLRPLPYEDPSRLVSVGTTPSDRYDGPIADETETARLMGSSVANYLDWKERSRSFEQLAAVEWVSIKVPGLNGPELIQSAKVTSEFFRALGVTPHIGRLFDEEEYRTAARVAVITHGAWVRRFGGDPGIVGQPLHGVKDGGFGGPAETEAWTIVGVLPADFRGPEALSVHNADAWVPLDLNDARYADRGMRSIVILGRLAAGVDVTGARAELWSVMEGVVADHPQGNVHPRDNSVFGASLNGLHLATVGDVGATLSVLLASVGILLVIACANVANMLLARGVDRIRELGLRMALGAGRARVGRQLVTESAVLGLLGGALGVLLSFGGVRLFVALAPGNLPRTADVAVDGRVLGFALILSLFTGVVFGLGPALQLTTGRVGDVLRTRSYGGRAGSRIRNALVSVELALAMILTVGAGLLINSLVRLQNVDPGFNPTGVETLTVRAPGGFEDPEATEAFWNRLQAELSTVPGVQSLSLASNIPGQSTNWRPGVLMPGEAMEDSRGVDAFVISTGFFETLEVPILRGRTIDETDIRGGARTAIVNQTFVDTYLPGGTGVGSTFLMSSIGGYGLESVEIVGVVGDFRQARTDAPAEPQIFTAYTQVTWPRINVLARKAGAVPGIADALRKTVGAVDPEQPVTGQQTLERRLSAFLVRPRFYAGLILAFSVVALTIAAAGVYGTMSYSVGRRTKELGIRLALGAERSEVRRLVLRSGLATTSVGVLLGLAGATELSRFLGDLLYEVPATDLATFGIVTLTLATVSMWASFVPAQRATRVDPLETLKAE